MERDKDQVIVGGELFIDDESGAVVDGFVAENGFPQSDDVVAMGVVVVIRNCDVHRMGGNN